MLSVGEPVTPQSPAWPHSPLWPQPLRPPAAATPSESSLLLLPAPTSQVTSQRASSLPRSLPPGTRGHPSWMRGISPLSFKSAPGPFFPNISGSSSSILTPTRPREVWRPRTSPPPHRARSPSGCRQHSRPQPGEGPAGGRGWRQGVGGASLEPLLHRSRLQEAPVLPTMGTFPNSGAQDLLHNPQVGSSSATLASPPCPQFSQTLIQAPP